MWKRKVVAMLLGICMTSQLCVNAFALENDKNSNANVEMNVSLAEQNSILELELKSSISQYLEEGADVSGIEELILNTSNGYQLTLAKLRMNFATEKVAQDTVTTIEKTEKTEVRGEDKVITTTKRVKTGDTNLMLRYSVIALASGVVCLILAVVTMNRRKKEAETAQRKGEK